MKATQITPTWKREPTQPTGVMVGCDAQQEWMLPWWYDCYKRYNDYPVEFIDFGLSPKGQQFCAERGRVVEVKGLPFKQIWYTKPFAILETEFRHCLWMDNDCEVRGSLAPIFDCRFKGADAVLVRDPYGGAQLHAGLYDDEIRYATAPALMRHGSALGPLWAEYCFIMSDYCYGDQHAMCRAIYLNGDKIRIAELPAGYVQFRLGGEPRNPIITHWTGPAGKAIIKANIAENEDLSDETNPVMEEII